MTTCPHCGAAYDATSRATGDRVWHPACDKWFLVVHLAGGVTELRKSEAPPDWPGRKEKKEKRK